MLVKQVEKVKEEWRQVMAQAYIEKERKGDMQEPNKNNSKREKGAKVELRRTLGNYLL